MHRARVLTCAPLTIEKQVAPEYRAMAVSATKHVLVFSGHVVRYACYIHVFTEYVAEITLCVGPSMMPTLNTSGDVILTESVARRLGTLKRGDVVVATSPRDAQTSICKRIIAMEGDRVCVNPDSMGRKVFRTVPTGSVWLQGDNLSNSTDSRTYGPVPLALVKSRAILRVWPLDQIGTVDSYYDPEDWPQEPLSRHLQKRSPGQSAVIGHRPSALGRTTDTYANVATCNNTKDDAQTQDANETHGTRSSLESAKASTTTEKGKVQSHDRIPNTGSVDVNGGSHRGVSTEDTQSKSSADVRVNYSGTTEAPADVDSGIRCSHNSSKSISIPKDNITVK
eukprot:m.295619 g.295619  ORF g.295619 m.295619 type:complete len:338 (+) comp20042_c1_seq3:318-1331(+)